MGSRLANCRTGLRLDRLDRQIQGDVVADEEGELAHVEIRSLDRDGRMGTAGVHLERGILHALEVGDGERHRPGHALDREVARQARLVAVKRHPGGFEGDRRIVGGVEEIRVLDLLVEQGVAGVHRGGVDHHVGRAGFGWPGRARPCR